MNQDKFRPKGGAELRVSSAAPRLGPGFGITVVSGPTLTSPAPAAPPSIQMAPPGGPILASGQSPVGGGRRGVDNFTPRGEKQVPLVMRPVDLPRPEYAPSPVMQGAAPLGADEAQGAEDGYLAEVHGTGPNGQALVARFQAIFPTGSRVLGMTVKRT